MKRVIRYIRHSLAAKLSIGFLLVAVPIFILSLGALFMRSLHIIRQEAKQHSEEVLNTMVQRVRSYLNTIEVATESNAWLITEHMNPDSLMEYSRRIVLLNRYVNGCSITTEPNIFPQYGRYFSAYSIVRGDSVVTQREGEYEYFYKAWYKVPKMRGKACWIEPFDDYNEGTLYTTEFIASYCKPLYSDAAPHQFVGVVSTDLSMKRLAEVITRDYYYPHAYYMLLNADGRNILTGRDSTPDSDCLVSRQQVPGTDWQLALVCPESDILKSYRLFTFMILLMAAGGLVVIVLLIRKAVGHAINPLQWLLRQSHQIAQGHYDLQIAHSRRLDAVGRLQNSFATMQQSLWQHLNAVGQANSQTQVRNDELARATKLAEEADHQKTIFMQNVTHQIRTPLNIIMGFAQVVRDSISQLSKGEIKSITDTMYYNARSLARMVLMLFDSSDTGLNRELADGRHREMVSCNDVARECIRHTEQHFPDLHINFATTVTDDKCVLTHRVYLMRSLREILYNAAKYSDGKHVSMIVMETSNTICFVIEDTGMGIPKEYQSVMFEFFTKVNDLSEGLGLGLPLSKRHIDNLGGTLTLDSTYDEGCRFIVELDKS